MSAPERDDARLSDPAEALLDGWPVPSRSALEWEDAANETMEAVQNTSIGSTENELLAPPLPVEDTDGSVPTALPDEPSLASMALARVASTPSLPKDLALEGLLVAEHGRRERVLQVESNRAAAEEARAAADEAYAARASSRPAAVHPDSHAVPAFHETAGSELPRAAEKSPESGKVRAAFFGGVALTLAAMTALYVSLRPRESERASSAMSSDVPHASAPAAPNVLGAGAAPAASAAALSLNDLPSPNDPTRVEPPKASAAAAAAPTSSDDLAFHVKKASGGSKLVLEKDGYAKVALAEDAQQDEGTAPAGKAAASAPPPAQAATNAALAPQPSLGAIQAAVGAVMGGARSCLAGQDTGSKATITFGSDGHVTSVTVVGPVAGTPAESCVRSALQAARVPAFADPSYAASLTVRPP